jgi:hypothetical protein
VKSSRKSLTLGCLGSLLLLGALATVAVVLLITQIPEISQQLPPDATPLLVNLTAPLDGSTLLLNTPVAVYAEAVGEKPVAAFELWVDGMLVQVESVTPGTGQTPFSASWAWTPTETGEHMLFARATDADGRVVNSNVVWVQAPALEEYPLPVSEPVPAGEDEGSSPPPPAPLPDPSVLPPEMQPEPGQPPVSAPPSSGWPDSVQPAPVTPPNKFRLWWAGQAGGAAAPPQPPEIGIGVDGCDVWLYVTDRADDEEGFFVYRLDPGSGAFKRIATLDRYDGSGPFAYVDQGLYGKFAYYVASFNTAGESPSQVTQLVEVTAPQCVLLENSGLQWVGGKITTPEPVNKVYCYMSFDKGPWTRVPPGANTFIYPTGGEFEVSEYINLLTTPPPQTDVSLALECWGWRGDTLIELGRIEQTIGPSQFNNPVVISGANFSLVGHIATQVLDGTGGPAPSAYIAPPQFLRATTNPAECKQLGQNLGSTLLELLCQGAIDAGDMILSWNWWPTIGCWPGGACKYDVEDIDGYRIYVHTLGQQPTLVRSVTNPQQKVVGIPPQPTTMLAPPCFTVRAFKGYLESEDSNCVQPIATQAKVTLDGQDDIWEAFFSKDGGPYFDYWGDKVFGGREGVRVGFYHDDSDSKCRAMFWRGVIHFDLAAVKGPVTGATLSAEFAGRTCKWDGCGLAQTVNCGTFLMADGADFAGPDVPLTAGVDVTAPVRAAQARGDTVVGFCLRGWDETMAPRCDDNVCYVEYNRDFRLDVSYNPAPGP